MNKFIVLFIVAIVVGFATSITHICLDRNQKIRLTDEQLAVLDAKQLILISILQNQCGISGTTSVFRVMDSIQAKMIVSHWEASKNYSEDAKKAIRFYINTANTSKKYYIPSEPTSQEDYRLRLKADKILREVAELAIEERK